MIKMWDSVNRLFEDIDDEIPVTDIAVNDRVIVTSPESTFNGLEGTVEFVDDNDITVLLDFDNEHQVRQIFDVAELEKIDTIIPDEEIQESLKESYSKKDSDYENDWRTQIYKKIANNLKNNNTLVIPEGIDTVSGSIYDHRNKNTFIVGLSEGERWYKSFRKLFKQILSIKLPNSLKRINNDGFSSNFKNCSEIGPFSSNIDMIDSFSFQGMSELNSIDLSKTKITKIDFATFANDYSLSDVKLPDTVHSIGGDAFAQCINLENINLEDLDLKDVTTGAFDGCEKLKKLVFSFNTQFKRVGWISESVSDQKVQIYLKDVPQDWLKDHEISDWLKIDNHQEVFPACDSEDIHLYKGNVKEGLNEDKSSESSLVSQLKGTPEFRKLSREDIARLLQIYINDQDENFGVVKYLENLTKDEILEWFHDLGEWSGLIFEFGGLEKEGLTMSLLQAAIPQDKKLLNAVIQYAEENKLLEPTGDTAGIKKTPSNYILYVFDKSENKGVLQDTVDAIEDIYLHKSAKLKESCSEDEDKHFINDLIAKLNEDVADKSMTVNVYDKDEVRSGLEFKNKDEEENIEKVVDVSAEVKDDLKPTYVGNAILQCPACKTMIYKDVDELEKAENPDADGDALYNVETECPHCGAKDGFELIGQVAALDVEEPEEDVEIEDKVIDSTESELEQETESLTESKLNKELVNRNFKVSEDK